MGHTAAPRMTTTPINLGTTDAMMIQRALEMCVSFHKEKHDRRGVPYALHPIRVMHRLVHPTPRRMCIALLHDTVEDTACTYEDIRLAVGASIANGVDLLTRPEGMTWKEYIDRMLLYIDVDDSLRADVLYTKLADIEDNTDPRRMDEKAAKRMPMYVEAHERICAHLGITPYLNPR